MTLDPEITRKALASASATVRALNPDIFGVSALVPKKPQPDPGCGGQDQGMGQSAPRLGYRIKIIRTAAKRLDHHENLKFAYKALVDRITSSLGFQSDDNPQLTWEYGQCEGDPGTIVIIQVERR